VKSTESNSTRTLPPWKSSTKASGVPVCWLIIGGNLEEMFHRKTVAESHPPLYFGNVYTFHNKM